MALINGTEKLYCRVLTHHHLKNGYRIFDIIFAFCTRNREKGATKRIHIWVNCVLDMDILLYFHICNALAEQSSYRKLKYSIPNGNFQYPLSVIGIQSEKNSSLVFLSTHIYICYQFTARTTYYFPVKENGNRNRN